MLKLHKHWRFGPNSGSNHLTLDLSRNGEDILFYLNDNDLLNWDDRGQGISVGNTIAPFCTYFSRLPMVVDVGTLPVSNLKSADLINKHIQLNWSLLMGSATRGGGTRFLFFVNCVLVSQHIEWIPTVCRYFFSLDETKPLCVYLFQLIFWTSRMFLWRCSWCEKRTKMFD